MAHFHDFRFQIFHSCVRTAVLAARLCVRWSVHVGKQRYFLNPQRIDYDMHMDIPAVVMPVRVGAYQRLVSGEMFFTKLLTQFLRPVNIQAVIGCVTGVKRNDIVVALYVLPFLVLAVFQIGAHTRYGKIFITTIQRGNAVIVTGDKPPVFVQCGLHGKLVMLKG